MKLYESILKLVFLVMCCGTLIASVSGTITFQANDTPALYPPFYVSLMSICGNDTFVDNETNTTLNMFVGVSNHNVTAVVTAKTNSTQFVVINMTGVTVYEVSDNTSLGTNGLIGLSGNDFSNPEIQIVRGMNEEIRTTTVPGSYSGLYDAYVRLNMTYEMKGYEPRPSEAIVHIPPQGANP